MARKSRMRRRVLLPVPVSWVISGKMKLKGCLIWLCLLLDDQPVSHKDDEEPGQDDGVASSNILPWYARKERLTVQTNVHIETSLKPGEYVMRTLFAEFTLEADKKITAVMSEGFVSHSHFLWHHQHICETVSHCCRNAPCRNLYNGERILSLTSCSVHSALSPNTAFRRCFEHYLHGLNVRASSGCLAATTSKKATPREGNESRSNIKYLYLKIKTKLLLWPAILQRC